jgi:hypothetical protein
MSKSTLHTSWLDYSLEPSNNKLVITQLTAGNVVAQLALVDTLISAMQAITLGQLRTSKVTYRDQIQDSTTPTDPTAQREMKWLVKYHDTTTGKKYRTEIPTADLTGTNLVTNSDLANLADTQIAAFVTAFEAVVTDPDTGLNSVAVDEIEFVGKRL